MTSCSVGDQMAACDRSDQERRQVVATFQWERGSHRLQRGSRQCRVSRWFASVLLWGHPPGSEGFRSPFVNVRCLAVWNVSLGSRRSSRDFVLLCEIFEVQGRTSLNRGVNVGGRNSPSSINSGPSKHEQDSLPNKDQPSIISGKWLCCN